MPKHQGYWLDKDKGRGWRGSREGEEEEGYTNKKSEPKFEGDDKIVAGRE